MNVGGDFQVQHLTMKMLGLALGWVPEAYRRSNSQTEHKVRHWPSRQAVRPQSQARKMYTIWSVSGSKLTMQRPQHEIAIEAMAGKLYDPRRSGCNSTVFGTMPPDAVDLGLVVETLFSGYEFRLSVGWSY